VIISSDWTRIYPRLEEMISEERKLYLQAREAQLAQERAELLQNRYAEFKKSVRASDWIHLPSKEVLVNQTEFRQLLYAEAGRIVEGRELDDLLTTLLTISAANAEIISEMFVRAHAHYLSADLAVAVFVLNNKNGSDSTTLITSHEASKELALRANSYGQKFTAADVKVSHYGIQVAKRLVELAGFDPKTALAKDLDEANPEFICLNEFCTGPSELNRTIFNWRAAVSTYRTSRLRQ
jgi:hypothetical protein